MISFVIPTYSRVDLLQLCIKSLRFHEPDYSKYRIIVVHDGGPRNVRDQIHRLYGRDTFIKLILKPNREGFSKGVNSGILASQDCDIVVLTNDDIQFIKPVIRSFIVAFQEDPRIGIVGAKLLLPNGLIQHSGVWWNGSPLHPKFFHVDYKSPGTEPRCNRPSDCVVTGALMGIRMQMIQTIGMLDEGFKLAYEDVDYCLTSVSKGWRSVYRPNITAIHNESSTRKRPNHMDRVCREANRIGNSRLLFKLQSGVYQAPINMHSDYYVRMH